jgi:hypothetical protein
MEPTMDKRAIFYFFISGLTALFGPKTQTFNIPDMSALGIAAICIAFTLFKADSFGSLFFLAGVATEQTHDDSIFPVNNRAYGFFEPWIREVQYELKGYGTIGFFCCWRLIW